MNPTTDAENNHVQPPSLFINREQALVWLVNYSNEILKPFKIKHSDKKLYEAICTNTSCTFIFKYRWDKNEEKFRFKEFATHSCDLQVDIFKSAQIMPESNQVFADIGNIKAEDLSNHILSTKGKFLTYRRSYYILHKLRMKKKKREQESYGLIKPWLAKIKETNPDSHYVYGEIVSGNNIPKFEYCFYSPSECKKALEFTLPIITLDACHTKGSYKGMIFTACAIVAPNKLYHLAIGVAPLENYNYWKIFIQGLSDSLGLNDINDLVILSDREKGLDRAMREIVPNANHSLCVFHIEKNIKSRFKCDTKGLIWKAARATTVSEFNNILAKLEEVRGSNVANYLRNIEPYLWSTAFFPAPRYGHVTSNIAESCNSSFKNLRSKVPMYILQDFVHLHEQNIKTNRVKYDVFPSNSLVDEVEIKILKLKNIARKLKIVECACPEFLEIQSERHSPYNEIYSKVLGQCSCGVKNELGYPCVHIYAVILRYNLMESTFINSKLKKATLKELYNIPCQIPVGVSSLMSNETRTAIERNRRGRPRLGERRIPSTSETINRRIITCTTCGNTGHNSRTCRNTGGVE